MEVSRLQRKTLLKLKEVLILHTEWYKENYLIFVFHFHAVLQIHGIKRHSMGIYNFMACNWCIQVFTTTIGQSIRQVSSNNTWLAFGFLFEKICKKCQMRVQGKCFLRLKKNL